MSTDEPADDLSKPLGQTKRKKRRFVLPIPWVARTVAGVLGICVAVLAGWIVFVDDPYGGEPAAVITAATAATQAKAAGEG
ncbi:MAG: divergent polysaccharide deacetylase family protein, partial [Xanthobacteraceae bacterium]